MSGWEKGIHGIQEWSLENHLKNTNAKFVDQIIKPQQKGDLQMNEWINKHSNFNYEERLLSQWRKNAA